MRIVLAMATLALVSCDKLAEPESLPAPSADVGGTMFVANKRDASLSRIDLASGRETHRAETCENPHELTVGPRRLNVMVACYSGHTVEIYRAADLELVREIQLGDGARVHSALWHANGHVFAGAEGRGTLYVVNEPLDTLSIPVEIGGGPSGPHLIAADPEGRFAWGTIVREGAVVRYDLAEGVEAGRRMIGGEIEALALSPGGESLWVGSNSAGRVYRLDAATLETVAEIVVGDTPIRIAAHPGGRWVATSNFGSGTISVIDATTDEVVRTISVSGRADAAQVTLVFSADGRRLYAAETAGDEIAEIDFASGEVLRRISTGPGGDGLAIID